MKFNIKNKSKLLLVFGLMTLLSACEYLDYDEDKNLTDEMLWAEYDYTKMYMSSVYLQLPLRRNYVDNAFLAASTDDAEHSETSSSIDRFNTGSLSMFSHPNQAWEKNYIGIRLANTFIENTDTVLFSKYINHYNYTSYMKDLGYWRGEVRFLKALFYFELIKRYGGVPIVEGTDDLSIDGTRKSFHEVVDYIASVCDEALLYLPNKSDLSTDVDLGRATKGAAYALKSRAFLYAASELHNPDGTYDYYYDSCAVNAAKLFIDYRLVDYSELFTPASSVHKSNTEVIFDIRSSGGSSLEQANYPVGFDKAKGYTNPTQDFVDAFEMKDGSTFDWNNPVHTADPYSNRDNRFDWNVVHNGTVMGADSEIGADIERPVECFNGGLDGPIQQHTMGTRTGYYLKKHLKTDMDLANGATVKHYWFLFRYAETLLNYAEAVNAKYGADADPLALGKTAREAMNEVRIRAGQGEYIETDAQLFTEKIRNERRVELAFEDQRHWDIRRWNIGEQVLNGPIHGVDIERTVDAAGIESFEYTLKDVETRVFSSYMNFYPIPSSEVLGGAEVVQNPGW